MKEFRFVGVHADELEGGRPVAPGEYTGPINERATQNKAHIDAGNLFPVEDGTAARVAAIDAAATKRLEDGDPSLTDEEWDKIGTDAQKAAVAEVTKAKTKKGDS
jgi:hypothetical protein